MAWRHQAAGNQRRRCAKSEYGAISGSGRMALARGVSKYRSEYQSSREISISEPAASWLSGSSVASERQRIRAAWRKKTAA